MCILYYNPPLKVQNQYCIRWEILEGNVKFKLGCNLQAGKFISVLAANAIMFNPDISLTKLFSSKQPRIF